MTNSEFLRAIFGAFFNRVHVTDFQYDPTDIPEGQHLISWAGSTFDRYRFRPPSNQYFCISLFHPDEEGTPRRRKALFDCTPVIVLDDVREKLSIEAVQRLPAPSWILETSRGSEQWGYILTEPCTDRARVENLLDGLVANGLAPNGKDPGMKGVTRYVRLPDGVNNKASKLQQGQPWQCRLLEWHPFSLVTLEQLAAPFAVNLDAPRREQRVDGAAAVSDHPLLSAGLNIKEVRSDGRFDVTCPWVDEHTGEDDSGTAIFTNSDGTLGFKCHHGACETRTGRDLLDWLNGQQPGFTERLQHWQAMRLLSDLPTDAGDAHGDSPADPLRLILDRLHATPYTDPAARQLAVDALKLAEGMDKMTQVSALREISQHMFWSKRESGDILKSLRKEWYEQKAATVDFYDDCVFIAETNQFYDRAKRMWLTPDAYQNYYSHQDAEARQTALMEGRAAKADRLDYAPKMPNLFTEGGVKYCNAWTQQQEAPGVQGDVSRWLNHFDVLRWGKYRKHVLQWMAYTLLYPEHKINHALILGSSEGGGKDFILMPLTRAMGNDAKVINGEELIEGFNPYLMSTKFLLVNESELGERKEAQAITAKLKPLTSAPPDRLSAHDKGVKKVSVRNIVSVALTTNSQQPLRLSGQSRRYLALWSDINTRDRSGNMTSEWLDYWIDRWTWMNNGGDQACIWYLRNCVDLSDFNPGAPPPVTDFLRDITDASKTAPLQTLEAFIRDGIGVFVHDLLTVDDAVTTLRSGEILAGHLMQIRPDWFTPVRVRMLLREAGAMPVGDDLWSISGTADPAGARDAYRLQVPVQTVLTVVK